MTVFSPNRTRPQGKTVIGEVITMKAEINQSGCIHCGLCADICPSVFRQGGTEAASVRVEQIPAKYKIEAETAEEQCPTNVIKIRK